ncbi:type IV pilus biogenesis/stability protein PilW [Colwellia psychrerythraea]|nr:type IV pilus biogenesis/stability protein PilW [Colwellia psychrerythraea]
MAKYILPTILAAVSLSLLSGCVTQSFENNEPIVKNQANRDEMAATRVSLGLGYLKMGDMSQAKLNLEKAKRFSPNLVQVHTAFAHYYETVGESELAIASFEQALIIKADSADTLNNYGVFLCRQDKIAAAEVQFLKAIAVPSYILVSQSYENLASCYLQSNDFEKAEMYLNKAIFHSPNRTATLLQMIRLQYAMGDYKESKRFLQKFERKTQRFTADSLALAYKLYWKLGQRRTANNYANMLVKMYPQSWEGKQYLLNELEYIDADDLARKYQVSEKEKNQHLSPSSNKRVVKLSPNKTKNSPYTSSVKTTIPATNSKKLPAVNSAATVVTTPIIENTVATNTAVNSATQSALGSGTTLLSATVAGAVVVTNLPVSHASTPVANTAAANTKELNPVINETGNVAAEEITTTAVLAQSDVNTLEPTSTKPVPATRDVPLPEAIHQEMETVVTIAEIHESAATITQESIKVTTPIIASAVLAESVGNSEVLDEEEVFHAVKPGENLYNISVKYNVKLDTLRRWNNISEKNKIRIGDKLYVVDPQTVKNIND